MDLSASKSGLKSLEGKPGVSPDLLHLEQCLLEWRHAAAGHIAIHYPSQAPDTSHLNEAIKTGATLVSSHDPLPAAALLSQRVDELLGAVRESLPDAGAIREWLDRHVAGENRDALLERWFTAVWKRDGDELQSLAGDANLDPEILSWTGRQLARPFFHRLGTYLSAHPAFKSRPVKTAGCPCCGGPARMGRYEREEGHRLLWCDLCNVQWAFPRVTCPFCLNDDQKKLGYLTFENVANYRVDVCEVCHGYLRAINERDLPEGDRVDFIIEDVGTYHLGIAAEKQDYHPGDLSGSTAGRASPSG